MAAQSKGREELIRGALCGFVPGRCGQVTGCVVTVAQGKRGFIPKSSGTGSHLTQSE